jgi:hypothetical protein
MNRKFIAANHQPGVIILIIIISGWVRDVFVYRAVHLVFLENVLSFSGNDLLLAPFQ